MTRKTLLAICLLLASLPLKAQFYLNGDDPARTRWYTLETPHYQFIYPLGVDSLARTYARHLEQFRVPMGRSIGTTPGEGQRRKLPVVLHAYNPYSNGSVGWAPSRMDLYTMPDAYGADPVPWSIQLTSHEPRHQAQFLSVGKGWFKLFNILGGEAWNPVAWQVYYGWALGEGDAVVAETSLWNGGTRARTADFLNYYRVALDQGDYRNWYRWRYGSYKHVTPDHYAAGYLAVAGTRYLAKNPMIMRETAERARKSPLRLSAGFRKVVRDNTGGKPFRELWRDILDTVNVHWQADAARRAPFLEMEQITPSASFPMDYATPQVCPDGTVFALREGYLQPAELVAIRDGRIRHVLYVNSTRAPLYYEPVKNRLYWTERRQGVRWKMSGSSVVTYYELGTGKTRDLATGHYYHNAQPSADGNLLATAEYLPEGTNYVVLLSAENGQLVRRTRVPDGIQAVEFGWLGETVYVQGIATEGYGIYRITPEGVWEEVLPPSVQKISNLSGKENCLEWVSDRTGVNELYRYEPDSGRLLQMTSTRYGTTDPVSDGQYLYTVSQTLEGAQLFRTPLSALQPREVVFSDVPSYFLADTLTAQEQALGPGPDLSSAVPMSAPKRYNKLMHPLRMHSWLPLYVNYDAVKEGSMDLTYKTASLGLSGFFQNTLGTVSGMVGYSLHRSPDNRENWRNAFHAKVTYSGQYPVFEASLDVGDRASRQYYVNQYIQPLITNQSLGVFLRKAPLVDLSFRVYVPLSIHRHGVTYGFIPQVRYSFSNNWLATDPIQWKVPKRFVGLRTRYKLTDVGADTNVPLQSLSASVRAYAVLSKAPSGVYPRLGVGAELGLRIRPGLSQLFPANLYAYAYGYLPGIWSTQGLKLTGMVQRQLRSGEQFFGEMAINTLPRGFQSGVSSVVAQGNPLQWKITADYAIPIYVGDLSIPGVAYITHFVLTPHADFAGLGNDNLWSAGADLTAQLAKLILPFDSSLGVSFSWLGGSWYANTGQEKPWSVSLILGMDF